MFVIDQCYFTEEALAHGETRLFMATLGLNQIFEYWECMGEVRHAFICLLHIAHWFTTDSIVSIWRPVLDFD